MDLLLLLILFHLSLLLVLTQILPSPKTLHPTFSSFLPINMYYKRKGKKYNCEGGLEAEKNNELKSYEGEKEVKGIRREIEER